MSSTHATEVTSDAAPAIGFFERYLTIWVALCILTGILIGRAFPGAFQSIASLELAQVNIPVGLLIWVMIIPMLIKIDFGAITQVKSQWRGIGVTLVVNWLVKLCWPRRRARQWCSSGANCAKGTLTSRCPKWH